MGISAERRGGEGSSVLSVEQRTAMNPPSVDFVAPRNRVSRASSATMHSLQMHAYQRSLSLYIYIYIVRVYDVTGVHEILRIIKL